MILTITSLKGGVGKTTISGLLALYLAGCQHREVVLIDLDPQQGLTTLFLDPPSGEITLFDLLQAAQNENWIGERFRQALISLPIALPQGGSLFAIAGDARLTTITPSSVSPEALQQILHEADLPPQAVVLIDTGTLRPLVALGMAAADAVLIPLMLSQQSIQPTVNTLALLQHTGTALLGLMPVEAGETCWEAHLLDGWRQAIQTRFSTLLLAAPDQPILPTLPHSKFLMRGQWAAAGFPERFLPIFQNLEPLLWVETDLGETGGES